MKNSFSEKIIIYSLLCIWAFICLFPIFWTVTTTFKIAPNVQKGDIVRYDNRIVKLENQFITILLNKPLGVITTVKDTHNRKTVMDLVNVSTRIFPIGRLDKNTSGAILLTNDGDLHQYLSHPKNKVEKDYEVVIEGLISDSQKQKLKKGIYIGYGEYGKAEILSQIKLKKRSTVILRLTQGKKREIRRIFLRLKIRLISIIRIRISGLSLGKLKIGKFRILNETEVKSLKKKH